MYLQSIHLNKIYAGKNRRVVMIDTNKEKPMFSRGLIRAGNDDDDEE